MTPNAQVSRALFADECERLAEWALIGPVQRAALESFAERLLAAERERCAKLVLSKSGCTLEGVEMEAKHTPGPWEIVKGDEWTTDIGTPEGEYDDGRKRHWNVASVNKRRDEWEANRCLIAAAPDLLAFAIAIRDSGIDAVGGIDVHELVCRATGENDGTGNCK